MNSEQVKEISHKRMIQIEEAYGQFDVPGEILEYFYLNHLLYLRSFDKYFECYGYMPLNPYRCKTAKTTLGWGELSRFEEEVISLLNKECERKEKVPCRHLPVAVDFQNQNRTYQ